RGLSDGRGQLMLPLPYPRPHLTLGSPLSGGGPSVIDQSWTVSLTVRYARRIAVPDVPDIEDVLTQPIAFTTDATLGSVRNCCSRLCSSRRRGRRLNRTRRMECQNI
ncbi:MAG TPA: hypothetical protein VNN08_14370, partial [Thermoanaerobaculia bacterium]|nr:hypothetical protein [Thermoanaerobaculia bacterium]